MNHLFAAVGALGVVLVFQGLTLSSRRVVEGRAVRTTGRRGPRYSPRLIAGCSAWFVAVLFLVGGLTSSLSVAIAIAVASATLPISISEGRRRRERKLAAGSWPDAIATLIANVRAGVSLPEACIHLSQRAPGHLEKGWRAFASTYRSSGSFEASIRRLRSELDDPIADRVGVALEVAHEVGGPELVRTLRTLGDLIREDLRVRAEIEARWSWTVTAARLAAAAPGAVLLMMATRPEAAAAYESRAGSTVISISVLATLLGYRLMLGAARLPEERTLPR